MAKFETIHDVFRYVKKENFMIDYSDINPKGGFNHRFCGRTNGGKVMALTDGDNESLNKALDLFIGDLIEFREKREDEKEFKKN